MNRIERKQQQKELLTFNEALEYYRVSRQTLLNALKNRDIPGFKIGAQWRIYPYSDVHGIMSRLQKNATLGD